MHPDFIAAESLSGRPNISSKGSFRVLDDEHVLFADVHSPNTIANLIENPQVASFVFEPSPRHGCRIWGTAQVLSSGDLFDQVNAELSGRKIHANHILVVSVTEFITALAFTARTVIPLPLAGWKIRTSFFCPETSPCSQW